MASISGNGARGHHTFTLTVTETATSNTANTSTLSYTFTLGLKSGAGSGWAWADEGTNIAYTIKINGTSVKTGYIASYNGTSTVTIATGTTTVTHDVGGAKTCAIAFTVTDRDGESYTCGAASGSGNMTLTKITIANYTLSVSAGTGSTITVNRTSSPKQGAATGNLSNGAKIYYSDVLKVTFGTSTGYTLGTHTVNGSSFTSGNNHTVSAAVSVVSTATVNSYKLTISQGANSTITVSRTSSPKQGASTGTLSNNATIYYSDVLKITFAAATGYNVGTHTVNGSSFTPGNSHTVTGAVSVVSTATVKSFKLTITQGTNSTVTVNRTSSPKGGASTGVLSNNATIYYSDVLTVTFTAASGYVIDTHTVNGNTFASGGSVTVTTAVSVVSSAKLDQLTVTISPGSNSSIQVERTSSAQGGFTGALMTGDILYTGDVLVIVFTANRGYELVTHTLNGVTFTSGGTYTVSGSSVLVECTVQQETDFTLSINQSEHVSVTVNRLGSTQGGSIGVLPNGAQLYLYDHLQVTFVVDNGYILSRRTLNGRCITSGNQEIVLSSISIVCVAQPVEGIRGVNVDNGSDFDRYVVFVDDGTAWNNVAVYFDNGIQWQLVEEAGYATGD